VLFFLAYLAVNTGFIFIPTEICVKRDVWEPVPTFIRDHRAIMEGLLKRRGRAILVI
jgi:hypothetical protein